MTMVEAEPTNFAWTDERVELLRKLYADGLSMTAMAKEIGAGTTRNAVIGKAHRLGLPKRGSPVAAEKPKRKHGVVQKPRAPEQLIAVVGPLLSREPDSGVPVEIIDLRDHHCRWPTKTEDGWRYCGKRRLHAKTWCCAGHYAMAYQPTPRLKVRAA